MLLGNLNITTNNKIVRKIITYNLKNNLKMLEEYKNGAIQCVILLFMGVANLRNGFELSLPMFYVSFYAI